MYVTRIIDAKHATPCKCNSVIIVARKALSSQIVVLILQLSAPSTRARSPPPRAIHPFLPKLAHYHADARYLVCVCKSVMNSVSVKV